MASPEQVTTSEQGILTDPYSLIEKFQRMKEGAVSKEDFVKWVKAQAQEVLAEELRRQMNPMLSGMEQIAKQAVRIRRDRPGEEIHLLTVNGGNRERGGQNENINWVQLRYGEDGSLLSVSSEFGHRRNISEDRLEQDVALSLLSIDLQGGSVNFRNSTVSIDAGFLIPPVQ